MTHKDTKGKIKLNLVPPRAYEQIAKVREFGNNKYGSAWGWLEACKESDFIEAAKRHLNAYAKGEITDPESGLDHLDHALTSLAMASELKEINKEVSPELLENIEEARKIFNKYDMDGFAVGGDIEPCS
jgi:hypothetical protein